MKLQITCIFVTLLGLHEIGVDVSASSSISKDPFRGISPEDEKLYKSSDVIQCKDGSKKFTRAQLNDDFCDCPDGTDEPGTSACPGGKFYCRNVGHVPVSLFSSRVNDGICDCCDGSDEYDGKVKCQNTCWEAGKVAREKLRKKIATYQEGVTIRKQEVEKAKLAIAKDEEELSRLKNEEKILKGLVEQLKEHKDEIEKAEEEERLQKEKEEKERKEAEEKAIREKTKTEGGTEQEEKEAETSAGIEDKDEETIDHDKVGLLEDLPSDQDVDKNQDTSPDVGKDSDTTKDEKLQDNGAEQHVVGEKDQSVMATKKEEPVSEAGNDVSSSQNHAEGNDVSEDTVGLSKEELGRLIASRWTGEKVEKGDKEGSSENNDHEETPTNTLDEEEDDYVSETDEETEDKKYEYDDLEDETPTDFQEEYHDDSSSHEPESNDDTDLTDISTLSNPSWLAKIQQTVRKIFKAVNLIRTPVDKSDAARVRSEYESASSKLSKIQSRISKLSDKLKHDFGREKEFYSFHGHCFESKQNKYTYKVCPFKDASQEEGYSRTRLGEWDKFDDSYRVMIFANGDKCWNGPDRSLKVKLRCGVSNEVTDVDEPSRCEYIAILSTPALCLEDKLKELQHKLDLMNKEQPSGHDEL